MLARVYPELCHAVSEGTIRLRERGAVNEKTIATIALRDEGFADLQETLQEAARWIEVAAAQGAHLAVLPETINLLHRKDDSTPL
jgi:hypothetical protein